MPHVFHTVITATVYAVQRDKVNVVICNYSPYSCDAGVCLWASAWV